MDPGSDIKLKRIHKYESGNALILETTIADVRFALAFVYGPNEDCPEFWRSVRDLTDQIGFDNVIPLWTVLTILLEQTQGQPLK